VARGLTETVRAYRRGSKVAKEEALGTWGRALTEASRVLPAAGMVPGAACWRRIAAYHADVFAQMGMIVQDLAAQLRAPGSAVPASREWMGTPKARLADMAANYHPEIAGRLTADAIMRLCLPDHAVSSRPTVIVDGRITSGIRVSEPVLSGSQAHALLENTTAGPLTIVGAAVEFHKGKAKLRGVMTSAPTYHELAPHEVGGFKFYSPAGAPIGWTTAVVTFLVESGSLTAAPLETGAPSVVPSSIGLLVTGTITNRSNERQCATVDATVVIGGRAVAGGSDIDWGQCLDPGSAGIVVVRVLGDAEPDATVLLIPSQAVLQP
jgi:hypothetical protein